MRWLLVVFCVVVQWAQAAPNILMLVAEDLSPRIGAYGDSVAQTPTLDALAQQSVRYTNAYTTAGVCAPSRAALLMGQHQISFSGMHMRTSTGPLGEYLARPPSALKAFPEMLRRAGYFTFTDSKLDYQFSGVRAGSGPFSIWDAQGAAAHWRQRRPGQPFFGLINFMQTHESGVMRIDVAPYSAAHAATQRMRKANGLVAAEITNPAKVQLPPYYPDLPEIRADIARHYDNVAAMDAQVASILQALADDGLADNTIVIWTTDHGDGLPRAKRELFDSGLKVPLLVLVPKALRSKLPTQGRWQPGSSDDRLVSFVDLAPTVLDMAGVQVSAEVRAQWHGVNFLTSQRQAIFASRDRIDEVMDRQRAVRDQRFKYIRSWYPEVPGGHPLAYRDNLDMMQALRTAFRRGELNRLQAQWFEGPGEEQLYDLLEDPHEVNNLALKANADDRLRNHRARLRGLLIDWLARVGDTAATAEAKLREGLLVEGSVPQTPTPNMRWQGDSLVLSDAGNASIGYRFTDGEPWRLYQTPFAITHQSVQVKAVRYGWRESKVRIVEREP
jgi:N-sulfoglucosamine sulfohydrolase